MSSEDEYYDFHERRYDRRRSSNRARRRGSAQTRRRRRYEDDYVAHKSRRSRAWYNQNAPRLLAACMFFFLLGYEILILKGPLTHREKASPAASSTISSDNSRRQNDNTQVPHVPTHPKPPEEAEPKPRKPIPPVVPPPPQPPKEKQPEPPSRRPISVESGATTADRVKAAAQPLPPPKGTTTPPYRPLRKHRRLSPNTDSVKVIGERKLAPASALSLESRAADADDDDTDDPDISSRRSRKKGPSGSSSGSRRVKKRTTDADADIDMNPPKARKRAKIGEGGAEPGAGENFWQWFQETKGSEKGTVSNRINCPEENKRLCQMFYKYLRKYKIRSIFDVSCAANADWMPGILRQAGNELWGFKYYCGETDENKMEVAKEKLTPLSFVEFIPDHWWRDGFPEDTELLFAWDTLAHIAYGRVWNFFVKAKKQDIKYILVDNYPGIMNDPSPKRHYLNLRKYPFRFPAAKEVVQNVTEPGESAKRQLLFYEGSMLPDNLQ